MGYNPYNDTKDQPVTAPETKVGEITEKPEPREILTEVGGHRIELAREGEQRPQTSRFCRENSEGDQCCDVDRHNSEPWSFSRVGLKKHRENPSGENDRGSDPFERTALPGGKATTHQDFNNPNVNPRF